MHAPQPAVAACLALLAPLAAQAPEADHEWMDPRRRFALVLPDGWRALTPDEGRRLAASSDAAVPAELLAPSPPHLLVFGAVDHWLRHGFDGRSLTLVEQAGEPEIGPAGIAAIRAHWQAVGGDTPWHRVEQLVAGTVGAEAHPAILGRLSVRQGNSEWQRFDAYVPTAGDTLIFGLRWPATDAAAGEAAWQRLTASMKIARAPRGPSRMASMLLWAAAFGIGIGVLLNMVRKRQRG